VTSSALPEAPALLAALREVPMFAGLTDEQLQCITARSQEIRVAAGQALIHEDQPVHELFVLLEGEVRGRRENGGADVSGYRWRKGQILGLLGFSQMNSPVTARVTAPSWMLRLPKARFEEVLQCVPKLVPRLIDELANRIQEIIQTNQYRDKLSALGKLSAGLAHELNNPASAAHRAAEGLRDYMRELRRSNCALGDADLSSEERSLVASFEEKLLDRAASSPALDSLEQSDLQQELEGWLNRQRIPNAMGLASGLAQAGVDRMALEELGKKFHGAVLSQVLAHVVSAAAAERLTREIEASTGRISELVRAVKEYTYMDRAPEQEVDVHHGIESTLTMLNFRFKRGVEVRREFDPDLPRVFARGSELNQVWTNLIDNAIDAMGGTGELRMRTYRELDYVVVEIIDNGPGIPDDIKPHIFEPFFTTKGVGEGSGIGLDTVYRIVNGHRGEVSFDSRPGRTSFQVRLPVKPSRLRDRAPVGSSNAGLNLTARQEFLIRKTLESLAEFSDSVLLLLYERLFELDPGVRQLFRIPIEQQAQKLKEMLATIVEMLDRFDELRPQLLELGRRHAHYGMQPAHCRPMKEALLWAMAQVLEADFDLETRAAWDSLLTAVCEAMLAIE